MFIQNVSYHEVQYGTHRRADVLIQIVDPGLDFPVPSNDRIFKEIHKFEFSDVECETDLYWGVSDDRTASARNRKNPD